MPAQLIAPIARRWRLVAAAGMIALAVAGSRLTDARAAAPAPAAPWRIHLNSAATEPLRLTLLHGGLDVADSNAAGFALSPLLDPERPPPGLGLEAKVEKADVGDRLRLIELVVRRDDKPLASLTRAADGSLRFNPSPDAPAPVAAGLEPVRETAAVLQGPMETVLYGDPDTTSDAAMILQAARLFARKLDLTRDLSLGQRVRLVYTRKVAADGHIVGPGDLLYAELDAPDGPVTFYRHQRQGSGEINYVDAAGGLTEYTLLRTPVDTVRITSNFGMRMHPLLGYTRMHQGLDFGAPVGSTVFAAGDGVVEEARWAGGYGSFIKLRHSAELETGYAHLSRWMPGLKVGQHIRQGQAIGFVGSTGLSTGPHLHYEVWRDGRPIDPKTVELIGRATLAGLELSNFATEKRRVADLLAKA